MLVFVKRGPSREDQGGILDFMRYLFGEYKPQAPGAAGDEIDTTVFPGNRGFFPEYVNFAPAGNPSFFILVAYLAVKGAAAVLAQFSKLEKLGIIKSSRNRIMVKDEALKQFLNLE